MPRLLVVLFAFAQLHSTVAFALVTRPTLPLAKAKSVRAELRMAESSSDSGLEFFQAGVLPNVAAQLGCTALVVAATIDPGPLHDFALLWQPPNLADGSQLAQWANPGAFWLRWGLLFGSGSYFDLQLELELPATATATDADVSSATEVEQVDNGPSKSLLLGGFTVVQSWKYAVVVSWFVTNTPADFPADFLSSTFYIATNFTVLLLLGLATYALIIGPEFPAASRLAVDKKSAASRLYLAALCLAGFSMLFGSTLAASSGMPELGIPFLGGAGLVVLSFPFISSAHALVRDPCCSG